VALHLGDDAVHRLVDLTVPFVLSKKIRHRANARTLERFRVQQMREAMKESLVRSGRPRSLV
jgi:hypothetical protein